MSEPLVSVIIPVYNGEKFLRSCVESVLRQGTQAMEVLVVDDGSTDGTWQLLLGLAREDSRIIPIHQENGGVSAARNAALARCRGQYVRFADADDIALEGSTAAMLDNMRRFDSDLVVCAYTEVTGAIRVKRCLAPDKPMVELDEFLRIFSRYSNSFFYGVLWNKLFRGDIIRENGLRFPLGMHWGEDFHFVTDYLAHVRRVSYHTQPVYDYNRRVEGTVVQQFFDCARHPLRNLKVRLAMYGNYRELYIQLGQYPRYRKTLWLFLFRFTLHN